MAKSRKKWFQPDEEKKRKIIEQLRDNKIEEVNGEDIGGGLGDTVKTQWPTFNQNNTGK